ncbi:putative permease [Ammonifex degensii KC4]|uniref:Permease n=1 Tax=Ammonifex degensii (strain DSM 10501 / KC4) TaxID=429009 RepID=C9R9N7_AMMDK|nr:permease [Ammonifex degensii]ACX53016.1 putative permease [Ammonifex degensii KC4]
MKRLSERQKFVLLVAAFVAAYFLPLENPRLQSALLEAFYMLHDYAREHVLFCLVPALFIAGAMTTFLSSQAVIRYLGPESKRWTAYGVGGGFGRDPGGLLLHGPTAFHGHL